MNLATRKGKSYLLSVLEINCWIEANKSLTIETKLNYLKTNSNAYSKRSRSFMPERLAELI